MFQLWIYFFSLHVSHWEKWLSYVIIFFNGLIWFLSFLIKFVHLANGFVARFFYILRKCFRSFHFKWTQSLFCWNVFFFSLLSSVDIYELKSKNQFLFNICFGLLVNNRFSVTLAVCDSRQKIYQRNKLNLISIRKLDLRRVDMRCS